MPLIVVTRREGAAHDPGPFVEPLGTVAVSVWKWLSPHFVVDHYKLWKEFPSEGLGGELVKEAHETVRPEDLQFALPSTNERLSDKASKLQGPLRPYHILELNGSFAWGRYRNVPATLAINFYTPWAEDAGDITFDTFRTGDLPFEGLFSLLCNCSVVDRKAFVRGVLEAVSTAEVTKKSRLRVEWAAVKESESLRDSSRALGLYDPRKESSLDSFVAQALRQRLRSKVVEKYPEMEPPKLDLLSRRNLDAIIRDVGTELEWVKGYTEYVDGVTEQLGVGAFPVGSTVFVGPEPESIDNVVGQVAASVEGRLIEVVKNRIDQWEDVRQVFRQGTSPRRKWRSLEGPWDE